MTSTLELPADLDEMVGDTVCHLYPEYGSAPRARCGVPRAEQAPHETYGSQDAAVCAGCGRPRCPACRRLHFAF